MMGNIYLQILTLRIVHEQLVHLLSKQERQELHVDEAFTPFADLNPLHYNPFTKGVWDQAVQRYNAAMSAAEQRIASKLRHQFRGLETNSQQVCRIPSLHTKFLDCGSRIFICHKIVIIIRCVILIKAALSKIHMGHGNRGIIWDFIRQK